MALSAVEGGQCDKLTLMRFAPDGFDALKHPYFHIELLMQSLR